MRHPPKTGRVKATTVSPPTSLQPVTATPKLPKNRHNFFQTQKITSQQPLQIDITRDLPEYISCDIIVFSDVKSTI
jgi:hypothetical protein